MIFPPLAQDFVRAFQSGQRFGELGADLNDLHDGRDQEAKEKRVSEETADGQHASRDLARADVHDHGADHAQKQTGGEAHDRRGSQGSQHVFEQTLHAARENILLALLRRDNP